MSVRPAPAISIACRQLDRSAANKIVHAIRRKGLTLHVSFEHPHRKWFLSDVTHVADAVAQFVVAHSDIVGVADTLFADGGPSQIFRGVETD
jgi:hypothetical protein